MKRLFKKFPPVFKNFYFLTALFFVVYMLFFDSNDIITQLKLTSKQEELESAKEFYVDEIVKVKNDREALHNNSDLLEKLAREKYLLKKESEDVYIIVEEE